MQAITMKQKINKQRILTYCLSRERKQKRKRKKKKKQEVSDRAYVEHNEQEKKDMEREEKKS